MRMLAFLSILGSLTAAVPARAEFNMITPDDAGPIASAVAEKADAASPPASAPTPPRDARVRNIATAVGFGDQVPLSFAVRQIVPTGVTVVYGRGADQSALVNWRGGRRWTTVLRAAVRPLGLRVSLHKERLAITQ